jgi:hypothetical protein
MKARDTVSFCSPLPVTLAHAIESAPVMLLSHGRGPCPLSATAHSKSLLVSSVSEVRAGTDGVTHCSHSAVRSVKNGLVHKAKVDL